MILKMTLRLFSFVLPIDNVPDINGPASSGKPLGIIKTAGTLNPDWEILTVQQVLNANI
jgi:hypothetical protein